MTYRAYGKQVKRGDEHIADAADETYAQIIADALNGERCPTAGVTRLLAERYGSDRVDLVMMRDVRECAWQSMKDWLRNPSIVIDPKMPPDTYRMQGVDYATRPDQTVWGRTDGHIWQRQQDEYACSCGARWDVADGDDHP